MFRAKELKYFSSAFIPCQIQKVPIKIHQRHHLIDKSLSNFNFLAVSLLACTPRLTQKSPGEPKQDTDIHTPGFFTMFFHQQDNFENILLISHFRCVSYLYTIGHCDTFQMKNYYQLTCNRLYCFSQNS